MPFLNCPRCGLSVRTEALDSSARACPRCDEQGDHVLLQRSSVIDRLDQSILRGFLRELRGAGSR